MNFNSVLIIVCTLAILGFIEQWSSALFEYSFLAVERDLLEIRHALDIYHTGETHFVADPDGSVRKVTP